MARNAHCELAVPPDTRYLSDVRRAVMEVLSESLFAPVKANLIALAVDEAIANIMEHGHGSRPGQAPAGAEDIVLVLDLTPDRLTVTIRDKGAGFDPRVVPDVNVNEHVKAGRKNGLGVFLIRRIMDEVNYAFRDNSENELQLIKYIDEGGGRAKSKELSLGNGQGALSLQ